MVNRHTYATGDDLREYIAGTSYASGWDSDSATIRRILEASSQMIDDYCEGGRFGPVTQTRYYDIGRGSLINSPQYFTVSQVDVIGSARALANQIPLDGWLISPTTVTAYDDTDRGSSTVLTEGYNNDFFLMPYNQSPKTILKLNEDTTNTLDSGQQTFAILGSWGYTSDTISVTTIDTIGSTTSTSISVASATNFGPAQAILVDSEQMYITSISGNTLTVERGINGTTAATHTSSTTAYRFDYPAIVAQACLDIAKLTFRNRDMGSGGLIGGGEVTITTNEAEIGSVLHALDDLRVTGTSNGVIF